MRKLILLFLFIDIAWAVFPERIEYAFRWDPAKGGPGTVAEVASLSGEEFGTVEAYSVRYYQMKQKGEVQTLLRERIRTDADDKAPEFCLKFRSVNPFPDSASCPLSLKFSYEADGAFVTPDSVATVYSLSCIGKGNEWAPKLHGKPLPCASRMIRYEGKKIRLEQWILPAGDTLFEISRRQKMGKEVNSAFEKAVRTLWKAGARPGASSKSELGSRCPE